MGSEIERKFLVKKDKWKNVVVKQQHNIEQGYIVNTKEKNVRIRIDNKKAFITIKGETKGISRAEFEYEIPLQDAEILMKDFCKATIKKIRHDVKHGDNLWEVDEFLEDNKGLLVAELELSDKDEKFELPLWAGEEVSNDKRYYNSYLSEHPFKDWE